MYNKNRRILLEIKKFLYIKEEIMTVDLPLNSTKSYILLECYHFYITCFLKILVTNDGRLSYSL